MKWNWIGPPTRNLEYGIGDITEKPYYTADKNPAQEEFPNEVLAIRSPGEEAGRRSNVRQIPAGASRLVREEKKNTGTSHGSEGTAP